MLIRNARFFLENRSEDRFKTRDIHFFLHCWVKNESQETADKTRQRVWSTSAWQKRMRCRRFSSIFSSSFFVDVCDNVCFERHETFYILRI
jgi:hypothetical protein